MYIKTDRNNHTFIVQEKYKNSNKSIKTKNKAKNMTYFIGNFLQSINRKGAKINRKNIDIIEAKMSWFQYK
ncbi:MAG TPA: hypothetical protein PLP73_01365 [Candidatus Absconditabacterales bacterium]|nr:hypothetical protein [Candidatus Absconditabacterales bacterium]